jgi:Fic family protein
MQLNELLAQVDALKKEIDQLRPLKPEVEHRVMQKFRLDWNYHSNAIEGNSLTLGETLAFLTEGLTASGKPLKDHLDIKGHNELIDFLYLFIKGEERLTEAVIREMHRILLREPYEMEAVTLDGRIVKKWIKLGAYKTEPNFVRTGSGEVHQYASPDDVGPAMDKLIQWHREHEEKTDLHPVVQAALLHHLFLAIHPFDDGNGRLGRILMNAVLIRHGFPPVVVKLAERDPYVAALRRADAGEPAGLIEFIAQGLFDSETLYLRGARGDSVEDYGDVDKAVALLKQELQAVPTPPEHSLEVQRQHFENHLIPLLARLDTKLAQFDELFATHRGDLLDPSRGRLLIEGTRMDCINWLRSIANAGALERDLFFRFHWEGFLKDGPNDFSFSFEFKIQYEKRKMQFFCERPSIRRQMVYQTWFSEDELKDFINGFTKTVLDQIQRNLTKNRPK